MWLLRTPANSTIGEAVSHSLLSQHNLAPPLLARFHNGLMYRFIQGRVCSSEDLTKEPVWRGVARRLGEWHAVLPIVSGVSTAAVQENDTGISLLGSHSKSSPSSETINGITPGKPTPNIWTVMHKWILALPVNTDAEKQRQPRLRKELERTLKELGDRPGLGKDGVILTSQIEPSGDSLTPDHSSSSATAISSAATSSYTPTKPANHPQTTWKPSTSSTTNTPPPPPPPST